MWCEKMKFASRLKLLRTTNEKTEQYELSEQTRGRDSVLDTTPAQTRPQEPRLELALCEAAPSRRREWIRQKKYLKK